MSVDMKPEAGFNGVAPSGTATIDLPTIGVYEQVTLIYGTATAGGPTQANMEAEIKEIRVKLNGKVQRRISAKQLFLLNASYVNTPIMDGRLPIYLAEPHRRTAQGELALAWGMLNVNSFQIEVDIDAGANSPTLALKSITRDAEMAITGIKKYRQFTMSATAVGLFIWNNMPNHEPYSAIHFDTTDINNLKSYRDNKLDKDVNRDDLVQRMHDNRLNPQAGQTQVIYDASRQVTDYLPMQVGGVNGGRKVKSLRIEFDMAAATTFNALTETVGPPD